MNPAYYLTQYLSGHGNFKWKLRKFSLVPTDKCKCGQVVTVHHTFWECMELQRERDQYKTELASAKITWPVTERESILEQVIKSTEKYVKDVLQQEESWDLARTRQAR